MGIHTINGFINAAGDETLASPTEPMPVSAGNGTNAVPTDAQPGEPGLPTTAQQMAFNGAKWDRVLTEEDIVSIPSGKTGIIATNSRLYARFAGGSYWQPLNLMAAEDTVALGHGLSTLSGAMRYIGASNWDRLRTPTTFNTGKFTAVGSSVLWTPTAGKKFRLMRIQVDVTGGVTAAAAGDLDIVCYDGATAMPVALSAYIPAAVTGNSWSSGWIDLANGVLSVAADNVLSINLSFALTAGVVRVTVAGTEE